MASDGEQYPQRICEIMESMTDSFVLYFQPNAFLKNISCLDCETAKKIFAEALHSSKHAMSMLLGWLLDQDESTSAQKEFYQLLKVNDGNLPQAMISPDGQTERRNVNNMAKLFVNLVEGDVKFANVTPNTVQQVMEILTEQKIIAKTGIQDIVQKKPLDAFTEILKLIRRNKPQWPFIVWNILEEMHPTDFRSSGEVLLTESKTRNAQSLYDRVMLNIWDFVFDPLTSCRDSQQDERNQMVVTAKEFLEIQKLIDAGVVSRNAVSINENPLKDYGRKKLFEVPDYAEDEETSLKRPVDGVPDLNLRNYQKELAQKPLNGENVIIFAPTGSGKTRVAVHIIIKHLEQGSENNPKKVCFFARTVPLAVQQHKYISKYLPKKYETFLLTGDSPHNTSLAAFIPEKDVIVMTPMILLNHFRRDLSSDLSLFTLLVFDECHHTRKSEPYNELMLLYLKMKSKSHLSLPQILGLTASFSAEKANLLPEAIDSVLQTCANLDASEISSVEIHKDELRKTVPVPIEDIQPLVERQEDEFMKNVDHVMRTLEEKAQKCKIGIGNAGVEALLGPEKIPCDRKSQQYNQWTVQLRKAAESHPLSSWETHMKARMLMIITDYLKHYNIALEAHEFIHIEDVLSYLDTSFKPFEKNKNSPKGENELLLAYKDFSKRMESCQHEENPNLSKLEEVIEKHLVSMGEQSRGIIFVKTRIMAAALACWFNRCTKDTIVKLRAISFTGTNAPESEGGMTQAQQEACLMNFLKGDIRLLVATPVGEEGIDVPDCNLVIRYNHVGNEISTIQTKGRSRKLDGFSILLAMPDIRDRENLNQDRARMMCKAVENIQHMEASKRLRKIEDFQEKAVRQQEDEEHREKAAQEKLKDVKFRMVCKRCEKTSISSEHVRTIFGKYRVAVDWNIWDNTSVKSSEVLYVDDVRMIGQVKCRASMGEESFCNSILGKLIFYHGMCFLTLGIENFKFYVGDEKEPYLFNQWKKAQYLINEIDTPDFKRYIEGSKRHQASLKKTQTKIVGSVREAHSEKENASEAMEKIQSELSEQTATLPSTTDQEDTGIETKQDRKVTDVEVKTDPPPNFFEGSPSSLSSTSCTNSSSSAQSRYEPRCGGPSDESHGPSHAACSGLSTYQDNDDHHQTKKMSLTAATKHLDKEEVKIDPLNREEECPQRFLDDAPFLSYNPK